MKQVLLPGSGRTTSQLGFGCAFWNTITAPQAARLLDAAYDAGIRHFDVAPFYLDGKAEAYVGTFLAAHPDATVTTKYGLLPPSGRSPHIRLARAVLGPAVRTLRKNIKRSIGPAGSAGVGAKASFEPEDAAKSLSRSLGLLKRPYVDLLLLHEADPQDLAKEGLLDWLREQVVAERVGAFGIGGQAAQISAIHSQHPDCGDVLQFDWNAMTQGQTFKDKFQIFFWIFSRDLHALRERFAQDKPLSRRWSDGVGVDMADPRAVSALMLKSALITNPDGVTLVYSANVEHIRRNVEVAGDVNLEQSVLRFLRIAGEAAIASRA